MARIRPRWPTRIGPRTHVSREPEGWSVKVRRGGHDFTEYFGDAVFGGRARALLAAQHGRDELLRRIEPDLRVRRRMPRGRRSKTSVVGVSLEAHEVGGRVYHRYVAEWQDPEKGLQRRRFLIEHHGDDGALARAVAAREAGVARSRAYLLAL